MWQRFNLKTMGQYHDLYLKSDILLLADAFENFRATCLRYYNFDPCHYFTSPGLSWDAMLKMTDIKLELMTDIDMFQFIEKGSQAVSHIFFDRYGKQTINIWKTSMRGHHQCMSCIWKLIISMVELWVSIFQPLLSNDEIKFYKL